MLRPADEVRRKRYEALDDFRAEIELMLDDERYSFAKDTLESVEETVSRMQCVTEGQRRTVESIRNSV